MLTRQEAHDIAGERFNNRIDLELSIIAEGIESMARAGYFSVSLEIPQYFHKGIMGKLPVDYIVESQKEHILIFW